MKKLLFIVNVDWFFISHRLPLALEALKRGYEVHIACGSTGKLEYLKSLNLNVHNLSVSRSGMGLLEEIHTFKEIYKILKLVKPDIAHFVTIKPVLYGGMASRVLGVNKKVFSISGLGFLFIRQGFKASVIRGVIKLFYNIALGGKNSHVIVQNPDDREVVLNIKQIPVSLIKGSGVDLSKYHYEKENNDQCIVVMASRLLKDKGVFEFINAAEILKSEYRDVEFALYGDLDEGNPATLLQEDIENIKNKGIVNIHGFSSNISKVFSNSNIIVLPSYREGLPKVLIEAAACGRAVVTTDVPGCRDAIEVDKTGLLCKVKDGVNLAQQIKKLILDFNLRNNMGQDGRKLAEKEFSIENVIEKHFKIYEDKL